MHGRLSSTRRALGAAAFLALALAAFASGADQAIDAEFYVNTYRSIGTTSVSGLRSMAMGGAGLGMADGVASIAANPAALGAFCGYGVETGLGFDWLDDGASDTDQVTFRLGGAVSLSHWKPYAPNQAVGMQINTRSYSGAAGVGMKREQTAAVLAYGFQLSDDLLAGVSAGLYGGKWKSSPGRDADGVPTSIYLDRAFTGGDFRLGGLYRFSDETTIGATAGYSIASYRDKQTFLPRSRNGNLHRWSLGVGAAHQLREDTLLLGDLWYDNIRTDVPGVMNERNRAWGVSAGVEQALLPEVLALRGGLYFGRTSFSTTGDAAMIPGGSYSKSRFGVTAGLGVRLYSFDIGYALDVNSGGDVKNLLDVAAEW